MTGPVDQNHHGLKIDALDYDLPRALIATTPASPRDSARMLVIERGGDAVRHCQVRDLPTFLDAGDRLFFNNTAVTPARIVGRRAGSGGRIEGLFLGVNPDGTWRMLLRSNGRLRPGLTVEISDPERSVPLGITLQERSGPVWSATVSDSETPEAILARVGQTPLPPYIVKARQDSTETVDDARDRAWYQTVYADPRHCESVAAPTAGLHFTDELLASLDDRGVGRSTVTLHVGAGTFKPVSAPTLDQHEMHTERWSVPAETMAHIQTTPGRRIAVGTTTVRTLESLPHPLPDPPRAMAGETDLLIAPPYTFRNVDGMLTNFHLPRSTLLALVAAMIGLDRLLEVYAEAIREGYRFYSYGDAMLILPLPGETS